MGGGGAGGGGAGGGEAGGGEAGGGEAGGGEAGGAASAHLGHSMNQSIVQQLTSDGNMRQRVLNASPTGLMHSTMCRLLRTRLMKWL